MEFQTLYWSVKKRILKTALNLVNVKDTIYTEEELEGKHTKQVMSILNDVRAYRQFTNDGAVLNAKVVESLEDTLAQHKVAAVQDQILLEKYDAYLVTIKKVLSTREHVPNKKEAKKIRQEAAKKGR